MCLVVFGWKYAPGKRIALAGNRDEFHARSTASMTWWDSPPMLAGRDLAAGGTWLGVGGRGRFGVVTNFRGGGIPAAAPSRGTLIPEFLAGSRSPLSFLEALASRGDAYAGFSLLLGDGDSLAYYCNRSGSPARLLAPGIYGLSNATLDAPWPKLTGSRHALGALLAGPSPDAAALLEVIADRHIAADALLPDTGVGLALERQLSPAFIVGADYGTRSSNALLLDEEGTGELLERSYGPDGSPLDTRRFRLHPAH
jgi:uncharacterized protein with NRDE domain